MIEVKSLKKVFDSDILKKKFTALEDVSFSLKPGEIVGFLGANGAGKTTLLKIVMGFIPASGGSFSFSSDLGAEPFEKIGFLPERPYFYPHLTGRELCHYLGSLSGLNQIQIEEKLPKLADMFHMDHALDRKTKNYSKGMLQRIGFMATLLHEPKFIILDEPLSGLDPIGRKELKDIIKNLRSQGKTVFFSSHIVSDVEEICDSVIFLKNGKIQYEGSVDRILKDNIKPNVEIQYYEDERLVSKVLSFEQKDQFIKEVVNNGNTLIKVESIKPSLEEIFYNLRNDE